MSECNGPPSPLAGYWADAADDEHRQYSVSRCRYARECPGDLRPGQCAKTEKVSDVSQGRYLTRKVAGTRDAATLPGILWLPLLQWASPLWFPSVCTRLWTCQTKLVTRTSCLFVDKISILVESSAALTPNISGFEPFVKVTFEKMANPDAHFSFLDISSSRICGNKGDVTFLRDGGVLWAHANCL